MTDSCAAPIAATPMGGSLWRLTGRGIDRTITADRRPDGTVAVDTQQGVDPDDADSWDVDYAALEAAIVEYLGLPADTSIRI